MKTPSPVKKADIARSFSLAAKTYDHCAIIQQEIGARLLERLDLLKDAPTTLLDIGAGTGALTRQLQQKFPKSNVWAIDIAQGMVDFAKRHQPWHLWKKVPTYLCADMEFLPFRTHSIDLIFSNCTFQWCFDLPQLFAELNRVLAPNGLIFFSTLGPNTLQELKQSWAAVDEYTHVNPFADMHDVGDVLLQSTFNDPVMDMEMLTLTYQSVQELLKDLKATGAHNMNFHRSPGLTPKRKLATMLEAYEQFKQIDGLYPATFEVIYGHAWKAESASHRRDKDGIVRIPADRIPVLS